MMIHDVTALVGKHKRRRRIGRGPGSGRGKTAGRGHKGSGSRAGASSQMHLTYEGGQMPYFRRIPKRGFTNAMFRKDYQVINIGMLEERFENGAQVNAESLKQVGLLRDVRQAVKILGDGELTKSLNVTATRFSASAKQKIESAGGTANQTAKR